MTNGPILVIGASGKTGSRVANILKQRGLEMRAVSRKAAIPFDWNDAGTWATAIHGVQAVYIVHPGLGMPDAAEQVGEFSRVAAHAGVKKAVLVSTPDDGSEFSQSMRAAEQNIVNAGLNLVSLRLRWFFQNFSEDFLLPAVLSGELRLPAGSGKEAFVDADDIAEVAVAVLMDDRHNGRNYELTGPRSMSFEKIVDEINTGAGCGLKYVPLSPDAYVSEQIMQGANQ